MASNVTSDVTSDSDLVQQFINITGTDETVAKNMLEAFNNNLEMAINMFLEGGHQEQPEVHEVHPGYSTLTSTSNSSHTHKRKKHSKHSSDDTRHGGEDSASSKEHNGGVIIDDDEEDEVRAPIPQRQEVLVEDQYHAIPYQPRARRVPSSVFNACRDFQKESDEYEEMLRNTKSDKKNRKRKRLHELFQPPIDLIHLGDFQSARDICNLKKKWLLVNIQSSIEFACQVVNRDVWSNQTVRDIINANFIMWQVSHDSDEGLHYGTFYSVKKFPHISVIDPRTGERMVVWENFGMKPSADQFAELATHFLSEHPALNESFESKEEDEEPVQKKTVIDLGEDDQLEAAISASLAAATEKTAREESDSPDTDETDMEEEEEGEGKQNNSDDTKNRNTNTDTSCSGKLQEENKTADDSSSHSCTSETPATHENESLSNTSSNSDEKATILLRLPDNGRKQILFPLECTLKELSLELSRLGWPDTRYEVIKAFPRQNISQLDQELTLKEIGLHKQETLFIQDR